MWEWRLRRPHGLVKTTVLLDNSTLILAFSSSVLESAFVSKSFPSASPVIYKNDRKARVKDLMRHLVLKRERKTWTRLKKKAENLITKAVFCCFWNCTAERYSLIAARRGWGGREKGREGTWGLLYFYMLGTLQPAWCWHQLASCLNRLLKSRRNIKARKLVPAISSKNFNWSWEVIGASLGVIKIDS